LFAKNVVPTGEVIFSFPFWLRIIFVLDYLLFDVVGIFVRSARGLSNFSPLIREQIMCSVFVEGRWGKKGEEGRGKGQM
jgi:hypothetical protein